MKPRVFISSVIEGYGAYRDAAAAGITAAGALPVRSEDVPAGDRTPRNVCLDLVASTDIYLVIVGARGGWTAPSGMKVTEEEYHHARKLAHPVLAFLERTDRDSDADRLARAVSDYVAGRFRRSFTTPEDLQAEVHRSIAALLPEFEMPKNNPQVASDAASEVQPLVDEVTIRVAVIPEGRMEVVDVLDLDSKALQTGILQAGHDPAVGFFSYERAKQVEGRQESLRISQVERARRMADLARIEIRTDGLVTVDTNVTGRDPSPDLTGLTQHLAILENEVRDAVRRCMRMAHATFETLDPHHRADRLLLNASMSGIEHRTWFTEPPVPGRGMPMRMSGPNTLVAFAVSRTISRSELGDSEQLCERVVALLRRAMAQE